MRARPVAGWTAITQPSDTHVKKVGHQGLARSLRFGTPVGLTAGKGRHRESGPRQQTVLKPEDLDLAWTLGLLTERCWKDSFLLESEISFVIPGEAQTPSREITMSLT